MDFNEKLFHRLVDYATVYSDGRGGVHFPQQSGSQHGNLKSEAAGALGMGQMPSAAFSVRGNRVYCVWKFTNN